MEDKELDTEELMALARDFAHWNSGVEERIRSGIEEFREEKQREINRLKTIVEYQANKIKMLENQIQL